MRRLLAFAFAGLFAQLIDGALGMAYGVTATTVLLSTGSSAAVASASVHLAEVGTTLVSGVSHWRFGNVNWRVVCWLAVPGAVGGFLGATVLSTVDGSWMKPSVSALLLILGVYILVRFAFGLARKAAPESHMRGRFLGPLGAGAGFVDAVGGGGWGPVTTPTLMTLGKMEPRRAIGSASASEFIVTSAASAGFLISLRDEPIEASLVLALLAGGVVAAPLAAWMAKRLPAAVMGTLVGGLIVVTNARTILLSAGVAGPARIVVLVALGGLSLALVARVVRGSGAGDPDADDLAAPGGMPPAQGADHVSTPG